MILRAPGRWVECPEERVRSPALTDLGAPLSKNVNAVAAPDGKQPLAAVHNQRCASDLNDRRMAGSSVTGSREVPIPTTVGASENGTGDLPCPVFRTNESRPVAPLPRVDRARRRRGLAIASRVINRRVVVIAFFPGRP
jgi:hypothetical protein